MDGGAQSAVDSLLGTLASVIRDEANLLTGVRGDVQFIKGEMESMNGFLQDAANDGHPNHQVQAWTKQVREVAYDSQNCIDRYVQTLGASRPSAGLLGSLQQAPRLVRTMPDRRRIAKQLRELKAQAREVGERRQRYGIKVVPRERPAARVASRPEEEDARRRSALCEAVELLDIDASAREVIAWLRGERRQRYRPKSALPVLADAWKNLSSSTCKYDALVVEYIKLARVLLGDEDPQNIGEAVAFLLQVMPPLTEVAKAKALQLGEKAMVKARKLREAAGVGVQELAKQLGLGGGWLMDVVLGGGHPGKTASSSSSSSSGVLPPQQQQQQEEQQQQQQEKKGKGADKEKAKEEPSPLGVEYMIKLVQWLTGVFGDEHPRAKLLAIVAPPVDVSTLEAEPHAHERATELARRVYQHPRAASHFDCMVWVDARLHSQRKERLLCILNQLSPSPQDQSTWKEEKLEQEIQQLLKGKKRFLIILADHEDPSPWAHITNALPPDHSDDSAIIVTPLIQQAPHFHGWYVASWFFLLRASHYKVQFYSHLDATRKKANELLQVVGKDYLREVDDILKKCRWDSFSTKMLLHALYANPHRSKEELHNLLHSLTDFNALSNAYQITRFCYDDLPIHYKNCLLYLSIFPPDSEIRRASLVKRWAAEYLINKRDGLSAMEEAERCFSALVDRGLVLPTEIGTSGKVKSCKVHHHVLSFIAKIARDENVWRTGLPPVLAHRLPVSNGIPLPQLSNRKQQATHCWRARKPDADFNDPMYGMAKFLNLLPASSQLGSVKVLDLEGCNGLNKHNLKNICNKLFQLKYLSLRNTDLTELPKEIEKLRYLETFDIRETKIQSFPPKIIIMLQKLVHLLAGRSKDPTGSDESLSTILMPRGVGSMANMQILSHVEVSEKVDEYELAQVGRLQQLRKLGVIVHGKDQARRLTLLLRVIGMLSERLCSLSIFIKPVAVHGADGEVSESSDMNTKGITVSTPKSLESLSISGKITGLPDWIKELHQLSKITLCRTSLTDSAMRILGELVSLRCIRLWHKSYTQRGLTLLKNEFKRLEFLVVEGSDISEIQFHENSAPKLEKIVWTFSTEEAALSGIGHLACLREIELNGNCHLGRLMQAIEDHPNQPNLTHNPIHQATTAAGASTIAGMLAHNPIPKAEGTAEADASNISGQQ